MNRAERRRLSRESGKDSRPIVMGPVKIPLGEIIKELGDEAACNLLVAWEQPNGSLKLTLYPGSVGSVPGFALSLADALEHPERWTKGEWHGV